MLTVFIFITCSFTSGQFSISSISPQWLSLKRWYNQDKLVLMLTVCKLMFCPTCCVFSPESIKNRSDIFYPVPERSCVPDSPVWYSTMPITLDVMTKMLTRILLVREIQEAHLHAQPIYVWWVGDTGLRAMGPRLCHDAANYIQLWHALWTLVTNACDNVYGYQAFLPCWWNGPWHFVKRGGYWTSYSVDCR